jgi:hypothetical protein
MAVYKNLFLLFQQAKLAKYKITLDCPKRLRAGLSSQAGMIQYISKPPPAYAARDAVKPAQLQRLTPQSRSVSSRDQGSIRVT